MVVETVANSRTKPEELAAPMKYKAALEADPVGKAHSLVTVCRSSGQRRSELSEIIIKGNEEEIWPKRKMRVVQLLRDVETRWSSLYNIVGRVIELYPMRIKFNGHLRFSPRYYLFRLLWPF